MQTKRVAAAPCNRNYAEAHAAVQRGAAVMASRHLDDTIQLLVRAAVVAPRPAPTGRAVTTERHRRALRGEADGEITGDE
jgi:hypothetical protein